MSFLLTFHGEVRWLVALTGLVAVVRFGLGSMRGAPFGKPDRIVMAIFTGLLDLNLVLGLLLLFGPQGGMAGFRLEHATTMLLAVVVAHLSALARRNPRPGTTCRNHLLLVLLALALVVVGVLRLRGGWVF